jgi:hypothetical protein
MYFKWARFFNEVRREKGTLITSKYVYCNIANSESHAVEGIRIKHTMRET